MKMAAEIGRHCLVDLTSMTRSVTSMTWSMQNRKSLTPPEVFKPAVIVRMLKQRNGRHEETRTPDLYRVKVAL